MGARIHFFPVPDRSSAIYCGEWHDGDGWTALPVAVTCPRCAQLIHEELELARRASPSADPPAVADAAAHHHP